MRKGLAMVLVALCCFACAQGSGKKTQDAASRVGELEAAMSRFQEQQRLRDAEIDMRLRDIATRLDSISSGKAPGPRGAKPVAERKAEKNSRQASTTRQPIVAGQVVPYSSLMQGAPAPQASSPVAQAAAPAPQPLPVTAPPATPSQPPVSQPTAAPQPAQPQPLPLHPPVVTLGETVPLTALAAPPAAAPKTAQPLEQPATRSTRGKGAQAASPAPQAAASPATAQPSSAPGMEEQVLYTDALRAVSANRNEEGRRKFNDFMAKFPSSSKTPEALYWIGESYVGDKSYNQAILSLKEVTTRYPSDPKAEDALYRIADAYERLGDKANAIFHLKMLVDEHPKSELAGKARQKLKQLGQ